MMALFPGGVSENNSDLKALCMKLALLELSCYASLAWCSASSSLVSLITTSSFLVVLGFELRPNTLSHSANPAFVLIFFFFFLWYWGLNSGPTP
jgi:hypothetical protein